MIYGQKSEKRDDLEEKQKSYRKKLKKLGQELSELQNHYKNEQAKLDEKTKSYEAKLKKIDDKLRDI